MTNLLISFLVFCVLAGVFLFVLKAVVDWVNRYFPIPADIIMKIAYALVALYAFLEYMVPFLRTLAGMAGLK